MAEGSDNIKKTFATRDLHIHLRGAVPANYFNEVSKKYSAQPLTSILKPNHKDFLQRQNHLKGFIDNPKNYSLSEVLLSYDSFEEFLASFLLSAYFVRNLEDFRGLLNSVLQSLKDQGLTYVEMTIAPTQYLLFDLDLETVMEELGAASCPGLEVKWIIDLVRDRGVEACEKLLVDCLSIDRNLFTGITLGGNEINFPGRDFGRLYELARENGLRTTVHAGEHSGAWSVRGAIEVLKVERIGHGISAIEDSEVCDLLIENNIPLEVCLSSNVATRAVPNLKSHPIRDLFDRGVAIILCTDDPFFFKTSLQNEYQLLESLGFRQAEMAEISENSERYAFSS